MLLITSICLATKIIKEHDGALADLKSIKDDIKKDRPTQLFRQSVPFMEIETHFSHHLSWWGRYIPWHRSRTRQDWMRY